MSLLEEHRWAGRIFAGDWVAASGGTDEVVEPATGSVLAEVGRADASDVDHGAKRAVEAQRAWAATGYPQRAAILRRAGELFEEHAAEIQGWIVRETGSGRGKAASEPQGAAEECYEAASLPSKALGEILPSAEPRLSLARRVPAGVVGVISPFNFPLILSIRSVAPALALGNAVILKPDPRTVIAGGVAIARVFEEAGLPEGVLQMLPGAAEVGAAIVDHPAVRIISFTGSTAAGRRVGARAGELLKRAHLELGGNSALIVLDDADLDLAASAGAWGSFLHQGQICMTTGRHLVHERVHDEYVARLAAKADALPVGDPTQEGVALGPIIDEGQRDKVHSLVTSSLDAGATLSAGGTYEGLFYRPTVLSDVTRDTPAYANEVFGPVAPVLPFSSIDEAIALASDSEYGLSLGILTNDAMRGLELAEQIPTGMVHINDQTVGGEPVAPFGGVGASGTGSRFGGAAANIEAFTETRWITMQGRIKEYPF